MQRLIWVRKRFWFAVLLLAAMLSGHWYAIAHRPVSVAQSIEMPIEPTPSSSTASPLVAAQPAAAATEASADTTDSKPAAR